MSDSTLEQPLVSAEEQLKSCLEKMKTLLTGEEGPNFKEFWEVRKECLVLFKEAIPTHLRASLWDRYMELTREARIVREHVDEESQFAAEQIDLAITALEKEVEAFLADNTLSKETLLSWPKPPRCLEKNYSLYREMQERLELLNLSASKVNALRKELIKTQLRSRQKSLFFTRLSAVGDHVFPKRKEMVTEMSTLFLQDVEHFVFQNFSKEHFDPEKVRRSVFFYREQIKGLQAIAKILSLNTQTFSKSRQSLSGCWDQLKGMEKELKKEYAEHKAASGKNVRLVEEKIEALAPELQDEGLTLEEGFKKIADLQSSMQKLSLTHADVQLLKQKLDLLAAPLNQRKEEQRAIEREKLEAQQKVAQAVFADCQSKIEDLRNQVESKSFEELLEDFELLKKELSAFEISKSHKKIIENELKKLHNLINTKRQEALLSLSADDQMALTKLNGMMDEKVEERRVVKQTIESYRKKGGGSALDFEQAMELNEQLAKEKERLEEIDQYIEDLQGKINQIT